MKLRSSVILGFFCFTSILAMDVRLDCKDVAVSGLMDAMWYSASVATTQQLIDENNQQNQGQKGEPGAPGEAGINCWDLNGNGVNDPEEDTNGDGEFNALDCQGPAGQDGQSTQGAPGAPGADGADGINCWDLNGNGVNDPEEDTNGDGEFNALDCQGAPGQDGADGQNGAPGQDGADGADGADGVNCWDLNGNGINDPNEDTNGDGVWDALDCQGAPGQDLTGVVARAVIPGADIPDPNDPGGPDWVPAAGAATGILRVYRPANPPGAPPTRGRYRVVVKLPDSSTDYVPEQIVTLVSVQAIHTDGGPPGSGGSTAQAFGFWEVVNIDNDADEVELEVMIRTAPLNFFTDATFSLIVLVP